VLAHFEAWRTFGEIIMATAVAPLAAQNEPRVDFLPLRGTDHVEFFVGNARQAAYFYRAAFGMSLVAYAGPETGRRDRVSYVLQQGKVRFVLTTPLRSDTPIAEHIARHGDGVKAIALWVDDARSAWEETTKRGAVSVIEPTETSDENGKAVVSAIAAYGDTLHTFVERKDYTGPFLPGYRAVTEDPIARPVGLLHIDHCVGNVGWNAMNEWVKFYEDVMGFGLYQHFDDNDISTEYSALMSKVMANGNGYVKFPINEPAEGKRKSQIEEYLDFYNGPGVQHIALATNDILETVAKMQAQGVEFLTVPHSYYTELQDRIGKIDEPIDELEKLGILVDRDDEGYMLQIFTRPVEDHPTLFYEIIQRKGSRSFGKGNFKALFEAIEREQASRGNL
jgi:4-hydroxyphenylpyruvate dioxygenase